MSAPSVERRLAGAVPAAALAEPHHDGSDAYVLERPDEPGEEVVLRLRVPRATPVDEVALRYVWDGEPRGVRAEVDEETATDVWYRARFPVWNPRTPYRWIMAGGAVGYRWLNGAGTFAHDVPDVDDFVVALAPGGPEWHLSSVVYQIFPDRFARGGVDAPPPEWAVPRGWDEPPTGRGPATPRELYGGDLRGIEQRLDHVEALGASALYLTPFFPATSTHRYDATSFDHVDPLLGGDAALAALAGAAHARGLRVIGDLTLNHCGIAHEWFQAALADEAAPERELFHFDPALPGGYESWVGVRVLPKLNWSSPELRRRMFAVAGHWLREPFALDGWRVDVAQMVGRFRDLDLNAEVAAEFRSVVEAARPDALVVAEHGHDFRGDLGGSGWHGTMNYAGFLRPVWVWLRGDEVPADLQRAFWGVPVGLPRLGGRQAVATMRAFRAGVPWAATLHSWALLDSHDSARFATVAGSTARHAVGIGLQMTTPGVPVVYAGDELGVEGDWGEDARRPMPWARAPGELFETYRALIALRRSSAALARGGLRYVFVGDDAIAYLREHGAERLLCLASRDEHPPLAVPLAALGCAALEPLLGAPEVETRDGVAQLPAAGPAFRIWRLT